MISINKPVIVPSWLFFLLISILLAGVSASAWARVDVLPKRLIFEPGTRTAMVTLINRSNETYTYRMDWEDLVYTPEGAFRVEEGAERVTPAASEFIRFAPRQVVLGPNESQSIRVLLRRPADLADGEYRSHFRFQRQAAVVSRTAVDNEGVAVNIQVAQGISIPIIVRQGEGEPVVSLIGARLQPHAQNSEQQQLHINLERQGRYSSYADITLWEERPGGDHLLAQGNERALNADMNHYSFALPLIQLPEGNPLRLEIRYTQRRGEAIYLEHYLSE